MIKMTILLRRKPETTHEDFVSYHRNKHAPLFSSLPEVKQYVRRYVQCHAGDQKMPGLPDNRIDGSTELWFDDLQVLVGVFSSAGYLAKIRPDEQQFLDLEACEFLVGEEHEIIPDAR